MLDNIGATSTFCKMSSPRTVPENLCSSTAFCGLKSALKFNTYSELCSMFSIQLSKEPAKFKLRSDHFSFRTLHMTNATLILHYSFYNSFDIHPYYSFDIHPVPSLRFNDGLPEDVTRAHQVLPYRIPRGVHGRRSVRAAPVRQRRGEVLVCGAFYRPNDIWNIPRQSHGRTLQLQEV